MCNLKEGRKESEKERKRKRKRKKRRKELQFSQGIHQNSVPAISLEDVFHGDCDVLDAVEAWGPSPNGLGKPLMVVLQEIRQHHLVHSARELGLVDWNEVRNLLLSIPK